MKKWRYPQISRRAFLLSAMALGACARSVGFAAKPAKRPQITRGPYLQRCHKRGIVLMWHTDVACNSHVRFGTDLEHLNQSFTIDGKRRRHVARIGGLNSNTRYFYSVGTTAEMLEGGSAEYYFRTAPTAAEAASVRMWVLGDSGNPGEKLMAVRDSYDAAFGEAETDLCIMLGDNAYPDGTDNEYQLAVFDMFGQYLRNTPLWPAYGNHDAQCESCVTAEQLGPFFSIFKTPTQGEAGGLASERRDYYSFDYGDVHFVCLNTHDGYGKQMTNWLRQDLERNNKKWLIAYCHHPPYSKGHHDSDVDSKLTRVRTNYVPVLEEYGVDLVLSGHNHCYERSFLINNHHGTSETLTDEMVVDGGDGSWAGDGAYAKDSGPSRGAVYVAVGCASQLKPGPLDHPVMLKSALAYGSLAIEIHGNELNAAFVDKNGSVQDSFALKKDGGNPISTQEDGKLYLPLFPT